MQIVIILRKNLNTTLSLRSVSILQFSEHFQLIFDNSNVNNNTQIKKTLESKVASSNRNRSAFLLHPSKTFFKLSTGFV